VPSFIKIAIDFILRLTILSHSNAQIKMVKPSLKSVVQSEPEVIVDSEPVDRPIIITEILMLYDKENRKFWFCRRSNSGPFAS